MASAALFSLEIERTKHSGVESAFSRYLVKRGLVEPEFGRIYYASRRQREEADYAEEWFIDEETVRRVVEDAVRFVDRIEAFLRESNSL